jgi:hypothetical protein
MTDGCGIYNKLTGGKNGYSIAYSFGDYPCCVVFLFRLDV